MPLHGAVFVAEPGNEGSAFEGLMHLLPSKEGICGPYVGIVWKSC